MGEWTVLVNNAGVSLITPAEETNSADWRRVLEVNLTGPFLTSREFGGEMLRQGSGSIVNIASVAGLLGIADRVAYNASKHGLIGLTRTLAAEWGARRTCQRRLSRLGQDRDGDVGSKSPKLKAARSPATSREPFSVEVTLRPSIP